MTDAKAAFCAQAPSRIHAVAKLPMIDPAAAAAELNRAITELGLVGMVCPRHIRDEKLDDPSFDVVWGEAERLGVPVCVHGGGQAPDQAPIAVDRLKTRLEVHAITHPVGNMLALDAFTVGGIMHRFPKLRVAFLESGCGWLPFWLERLDEHYELMPEQAPAIDRKPSAYFLDGHGYIACEPDEEILPYVVQRFGASALRRPEARLRIGLLPLGLQVPRHGQADRRAHRHLRGGQEADLLEQRGTAVRALAALVREPAQGPTAGSCQRQ
jgi:predicted TIM-barrel fold metal-dependent hydrolase